MPRNLYPQGLDATNQMLAQQQQPGMLERVANSAPVNATLGAGDAFRNMLGGAASLIPGVNIPNVKSGEGGAYTAGNIAGEIGGFVVGGELLDALRLGGAARGIPGLSALSGEGLRGAGRRVLGNTIGGAVGNPEDQSKGATQGAGISAALEAIPYVGKGISKVAEVVNPSKAASELVKTISSSYKEAKNRISNDFFKPTVEKFKKTLVANPGQEIESIKQALLDPNMHPFYTPKVKKLTTKFVNNPTVRNAHFLQSQMGKDAASFKADIHTKQALEEGQELVLDKLSNFFHKKSPELGQKFENGRSAYRQEIGPHHSSKFIEEISRGKNKRVSPKKLEAELLKVNAGASHPLSKALEDISGKLSRSNTATTLGSLGAGAIGSIGGPMGALGTAAATKLLGPGALELSQNPHFLQILESLAPTGNAAKKAALATALQGRQQ